MWKSDWILSLSAACRALSLSLSHSQLLSLLPFTAIASLSPISPPPPHLPPHSSPRSLSYHPSPNDGRVPFSLTYFLRTCWDKNVVGVADKGIASFDCEIVWSVSANVISSGACRYVIAVFVFPHKDVIAVGHVRAGASIEETRPVLSVSQNLITTYVFSVGKVTYYIIVT